MSFFGKLEVFALQDMLQVFAASKETGKLRLTRRDREGIVVFRNGMIVYAASSSARQTLGNLLLLEGIVDEEKLSLALDEQHAAKEEKRLGSILTEIGAIDEETLERIVRQQTERVVSEFLSWETGYFKLDRVELSDLGEIEVDARDFLMREGLDAEDLLSDIESKIEEFQQLEAPPSASEAHNATAPSAESARDLETLKSIMGEIRSPEFTGEITQKILSFAQELFSRGVLFVVRQDGFGVMGQFGIESDNGSTEARLRQLLIPDDQPSILSETAGRKESKAGPLEDTEWNQKLLEEIGGPAPGDSVTVPLTVNDRVLLVLYGDNMQENLAPGWLEKLELLMLQAGLAMEKDLLVKRIQHYENLRRQD